MPGRRGTAGPLSPTVAPSRGSARPSRCQFQRRSDRVGPGGGAVASSASRVRWASLARSAPLARGEGSGEERRGVPAPRAPPPRSARPLSAQPGLPQHAEGGRTSSPPLPHASASPCGPIPLRGQKLAHTSRQRPVHWETWAFCPRLYPTGHARTYTEQAHIHGNLSSGLGLYTSVDGGQVHNQQSPIQT